jgi:hypothetical protein
LLSWWQIGNELKLLSVSYEEVGEPISFENSLYQLFFYAVKHHYCGHILSLLFKTKVGYWKKCILSIHLAYPTNIFAFPWVLF